MVSAREDGYFAIESLGDARVRPDAKFTSILLKDGKSKLRMTSWHEVYQSDLKLIATSAGCWGKESTPYQTPLPCVG